MSGLTPDRCIAFDNITTFRDAAGLSVTIALSTRVASSSALQRKTRVRCVLDKTLLEDRRHPGYENVLGHIAGDD
jgi:hypothetical protein